MGRCIQCFRGTEPAGTGNLASIESVSGTLCCLGKCIMKHAECVLVCVCKRASVGGRKGRGRGKSVYICVCMHGFKRKGRGYLLFIYFYFIFVLFCNKMTNYVTLDIIRGGYVGQITAQTYIS